MKKRKKDNLQKNKNKNTCKTGQMGFESNKKNNFPTCSNGI